VAKSRGADGKRRTDQNGPPRLGLDNPLGQLLVEILGVKEVSPDGQVRAVLLERADGEEHHRAVAVERVNLGEAELGEAVDHCAASPTACSGGATGASINAPRAASIALSNCFCRRASFALWAGRLAARMTSRVLWRSSHQ